MHFLKCLELNNEIERRGGLFFIDQTDLTFIIEQSFNMAAERLNGYAKFIFD
ncbi:hypothetical protein [Pseudomonas sp. dw_358]|uniref:hypothetical protein n=1 Tax=Pseudomonas sp. dw_358 TaxID=2720083 RepID=UPI001BD24280|nr:hypothetical protein [Pseudomonas sp. dw_358]